MSCCELCRCNVLGVDLLWFPATLEPRSLTLHEGQLILKTVRKRRWPSRCNCDDERREEQHRFAEHVLTNGTA
jgi:hypothetical protein